MEIRSAEFVNSSHDLAHCPGEKFPEFAFIGRSNVGKSTLINALCQRKNLAHTSSSPGKTQSINHFLIDGKWYIVDLPGYGYARVSKTQRADFHERIETYMVERKTLACVFVLIDSRISPQKIDQDFINWLGEHSIPFVMVFTKAEKVKMAEREKVWNLWQEALSANWENFPPHLWTSGVQGEGRTDLLRLISSVLNDK